jgi:hypothetical protein
MLTFANKVHKACYLVRQFLLPNLNINSREQIATKPHSFLTTREIYILSEVSEIMLRQASL